MALTKTTLPALTPTHAVPYDTAQAFALAQTITATGYATNVNTQVTMGPGRMEGYWALDISNLKVSAGNETYGFYLMGSNDSGWGNGNVELLAAHDFAAASSGRLVPTILAVTPAEPVVGLNATRHAIPFSNQMGDYVFEYMQLYLVLGGTSPTVTFSSWLSPWSGQKS